jgi:hypothetical protein
MGARWAGRARRCMGAASFRRCGLFVCVCVCVCVVCGERWQGYKVTWKESGPCVQVDNTGKVARFNRMYNRELVAKQKAEKARADAAFAKAEAEKYGEQE